MPTTLAQPLRDLKLSELKAGLLRNKSRQDEIQVRGAGRLQTPEFWSLQVDAVKLRAEIDCRARRPDVVEK